MLAGTAGDLRHARGLLGFSTRTTRCCRPTSTARRRRPAGAPNPFLMSGQSSTWKLWRFHVDFGTPANSTFTLGGNLTPAGVHRALPDDAQLRAAARARRARSTASATAACSALAYRRFADGTKRSSATTRSRRAASPASAGTRSTTRRRARPSFVAAEHLPARHDLALDGQRGDGRAAATSPSASAPRAPASTRRSATRGGWPAIRRTRWRRARRRSSPAPAARPAPAAAGATTAT